MTIVVLLAVIAMSIVVMDLDVRVARLDRKAYAYPNMRLVAALLSIAALVFAIIGLVE